MDQHKITAALGDALNSSPRPPALAGLSRPRYPMRELMPQRNTDGTMTVHVAKWGWEYKHRGPRPASPAPINPAAVRDTLASVMPDGVTIQAVEDHGTFITITLQETKSL